MTGVRLIRKADSGSLFSYFLGIFAPLLVGQLKNWTRNGGERGNGMQERAAGGNQTQGICSKDHSFYTLGTHSINCTALWLSG